MKRLLASLALVAITATAVVAAPSTQPTTKPTPINKLCPVTKEPVDPDCKTYEYQGKIIGFCCPGCVSDFKKDPEKYMKDLK